MKQIALIQARLRAGKKKLIFNEHLLYANHEVRAWHALFYGILKITLTRNFTILLLKKLRLKRGHYLDQVTIPVGVC